MTETNRDLELTFGSAHRIGRDTSAYQADRLERLCRFSLRLLDANRRHLREEQRRGREVWAGKQWLEQEREKCEQTVKNMRDWTRELEDARVWHSAECQRLTKLVEELQATVDRQARRIAELEQGGRQEPRD
ncbi:MAG: hypothetical protein JXO22_11135 [Phycisphaerae bacterium]|nr:hypothetical protein [Phycisphaerae bacterium]